MRTITVQTVVDAPIKKVWDFWSKPKHITGWAFASGDWEAPEAENDLRVGGKFKTRMQSKDGKEGFDFTGTYTAIKENKLIEYTMDDKRHVKVVFEEVSDGVRITETFEPENENSEDVQREGWQTIMDNFKEYCEDEEEEEEEEEDEEKSDEKKNTGKKPGPGSSLKTLSTFIVGTALGAAVGASAALLVCRNNETSPAHLSVPVADTSTPVKASASTPAPATIPRKTTTEVKPASSAGTVALPAATTTEASTEPVPDKSADGTSAADGSVAP